MPIDRLSAPFVAELARNFAHLETIDLSHNAISCIENLGALSELRSLDLSFNNIDVLDGVNVLPRLHHLNVAHNQISSIRDSIALATSLESLDLTHNHIEQSVDLSPLLPLSSLRSLLLDGNPLCASRHYRRHVIDLLPQLQILDGRPVLMVERMSESSSPSPRRSPMRTSSSPMRSRGVTSVSRDLEGQAKSLKAYFGATNGRGRSERRRDGELPSEKARRGDVNALERQIELRDIQIQSYEKILEIHEREGGHDLLKSWREKVYQLLLLSKSTELTTARDRDADRRRYDDLLGQHRTSLSQIEMLSSMIEQLRAENEVLMSRKQALEGIVSDGNSRCAALKRAISLRDGKENGLRALIWQLSQYSVRCVEALEGVFDEFEGYSSRITFALSRIECVKHMFNSRLDVPPHPPQSLSSSPRPMNAPRMQTMTSEIQRLTQERSALMHQVAECNRRERLTTEKATTTMSEERDIAARQIAAATRQNDDLVKENATLTATIVALKAQLEEQSTSATRDRDLLVAQQTVQLEDCARSRALLEASSSRVAALEEEIKRQTALSAESIAVLQEQLAVAMRKAETTDTPVQTEDMSTINQLERLASLSAALLTQ